MHGSGGLAEGAALGPGQVVGEAPLRILAIDTALGACSVCLTDDAPEAEPHEAIIHESIAMERGHAEALLPLIEQVMSRVPDGFAALDRVAVTVGPGSYTGLRVGISAARAIGLAAGVPVIGVSTLSALLAPMVAAESRRLLAAAIDARHGHVYFHAVAPGGRTVVSPSLVSVRDAVRLIGSGPVLVSGSGAPALAAEALALRGNASVFDAPVAVDVLWVAKLAQAASPEAALPKPLYLRAPDARPQEAARLPRR